MFNVSITILPHATLLLTSFKRNFKFMQLCKSKNFMDVILIMLLIVKFFIENFKSIIIQALMSHLLMQKRFVDIPPTTEKTKQTLILTL